MRTLTLAYRDIDRPPVNGAVHQVALRMYMVVLP